MKTSRLGGRADGGQCTRAHTLDAESDNVRIPVTSYWQPWPGPGSRSLRAPQPHSDHGAGRTYRFPKEV